MNYGRFYSSNKTNTSGRFGGSRYLLLLFFLMASLAIGTRSEDLGADTLAYVNMFNNFTNQDFISLWPEPGFYLFAKITQYFNGDVSSFFLIFSLLTNFLIYKAISEYSENQALSIFVYCGFGFFLLQFNLLRQGLAMAIVLSSFTSLIQKNKLKFIIYIITASLFHYTAIISLIILFAANRRFIKYSLYLIPITFIIYFIELKFNLFLIVVKAILNSEIIFGQYVSYQEDLSGSLGWGLKKFIQGCLIYFSALALFWGKKKFLISEINAALIGISIIGWFLTVIFASSTIALRVALYFDIFSILLIPNGIMAILGWKRYLFIIISIFFCLIMLFNDLLSGNYGVGHYNLYIYFD